ncbi:type IV secretory system conjugative DNA transfer family protein [Streptomyces sp. NPDC005876]|uniref:type IV secretory system conjugative DNA transfer family protein n=1 Tax=unclassified Streptomyces TaxID=2593676 RepID=UPI0033D47014
MRPDDRQRTAQGGGVPDGLLVGVLAFLLGVTVLVWTATGLAALFAHGAWPDRTTFPRTPLAMRHLVAHPHDIPGAWPDADPSQLSGYGLFWGLFIGQLMILAVLAVFVLTTLTRWRAVRGRVRKTPLRAQETPAQESPAQKSPAQESPAQESPAPETPTRLQETVPAPRTPRPEPEPVERAEPVVASPPGIERVAGWETPRPEGALRYGPRPAHRLAATQAVRDAEGPALVLTSTPALWQETKDARAKLGPTHLYDPTHLCDTPNRLHWSPTTGCEDKDTAACRAAALLTPVRPTAKLDQAVTHTAETLLRSYLHAAAVDARTIRHVHRWSQGSQVQDAVRILRTHPKAAPGAAGELEAALTAHPERRDMAHQLTNRALAALSTVNIRESCTPHRNDALALDSFIQEGGTLYVVGEPIEDPRTAPGAMPLLTALVSSVVEHGRRMAARSSSGRLDPPLTLVLDDVAAVAPLPQLPELLATGADQGLPALALLRSREQARARWPHAELPV